MRQEGVYCIMQPAMHSLRQKITFGYAAIATLVVGLSVLSFLELRALEEKIMAGEHVSEFLGLSLEIRRFEKNYFLYRQEADLMENRSYVSLTRTLLQKEFSAFEAIFPLERVVGLERDLERYAALMDEYAYTTEPHEFLEARIRQSGKEIVTIAEGLARAERKAFQVLLERHRQMLMASVLAVVVLVIVIGQRLIGTFNRALREMELRQGQLVRSEKLAALGILLSGVAHEINNPLSNISSSCEILAEEVGAGGTAFQRELLDQIDTETWRARRIVRSLLDYARNREFHKETLPLTSLLEETLRLVKGQIPAHVHVVCQIADEMIVVGDKQRFQQMFFNLIGNAVESVEGAGEVSIRARRLGVAMQPDSGPAMIFGQCPEQGEVMEIEVRDNGHGIPANILPRIFDPFFTTKEVGHGLGLGLFIVFEIVEEHGGCIAVESRPDQGTTFFVRLPLEKA